MVMRADVLARAINAVGADARPRLLMSPRGRPLTQDRVAALAAGEGAVILCGRFEGIDERLIAARALEEVSIGDYVLAGGEVAAMVLIEAAVRLIPGVMASASSRMRVTSHGSTRVSPGSGVVTEVVPITLTVPTGTKMSPSPGRRSLLMTVLTQRML